MLFRIAGSHIARLATAIVAVSSTACLAALPAAAATADTIVVIGKKQPADPCLAVAAAKYAQWGQERMMVQETRTLADGKKQVVEEVFTGDAAYGRLDGLPWHTVQLSRPQRVAYSPENVAQKMKLGTCEFAGADDQDGQAA